MSNKSKKNKKNNKFSAKKEQDVTKNSNEFQNKIERDSAKSDIDWNQLSVHFHNQTTSLQSDVASNGTDSRDALVEALGKAFVIQQYQVVNQRKKLLKWFMVALAIQLVVINILVSICVCVFIWGKYSSIVPLFNFMKFFIGATFVEVLGGFFIIVKVIFSPETSDMLKDLNKAKRFDDGSNVQRKKRGFLHLDK